METTTDKTIVQLDLQNRWADLLSQFATEHPFLNVTIHVRPTKDDSISMKRVEFNTYNCSKQEANKRFFYFLLIYSEWAKLKS